MSGPGDSRAGGGRLTGCRTLLAAAAGIGAEALGLFGLAVFYLVELVVSRPDSISRALSAVALLAVSAAGLLACAAGLARARRAARSPTLVVQLVALPVAWTLVQGGRWYVGAPVALLAVAVAALLFVPATAAALGE